MAADELVVHGAREHNLKDINSVPAQPLIVITGPRLRQIEAGVRHDLRRGAAPLRRVAVRVRAAVPRKMEKPDVDHIEGLCPAIAIEQKTTSRNPRSTVGTVTEIYDYLRLLYARVGRPHCPVCGKPIAGQTIDAIVEQVLALDEGTNSGSSRRSSATARASSRMSSRSSAAKGSCASRSTASSTSSRSVPAARQEVQAHDRRRRRPARHDAGTCACA